MKHPEGYITCDGTKEAFILNDGKTLLPGYVEIRDGNVYQHFSDDPRNTPDPNNPLKPWDITNRVEFDREEYSGTADKELNGKHFLSLDVYNKYVSSQKEDRPQAHTVADVMQKISDTLDSDK